MGKNGNVKMPNHQILNVGDGPLGGGEVTRMVPDEWGLVLL